MLFMVNPSATATKRGRPPKTEADQDQLKAQIAQATLQAFAEHGSYGMNVEHVLAYAGISRPTFYKYFRHLDEPLAQAALQIHEDLIQNLNNALEQNPDPMQSAILAFEAYVAWARNLGQVMAPLYAEFYDKNSPIAAFRLQTIDHVMHLIADKTQQSGRPRPSITMLTMFMTGIEFLAFRFLLQTDQSDSAWAETRQAMLHLLVATFGTMQDLPLISALWQYNASINTR